MLCITKNAVESTSMRNCFLALQELVFEPEQCFFLLLLLEILRNISHKCTSKENGWLVNVMMLVAAKISNCTSAYSTKVKPTSKFQHHQLLGLEKDCQLCSCSPISQQRPSECDHVPLPVRLQAEHLSLVSQLTCCDTFPGYL
jgi:hypothetical protein